MNIYYNKNILITGGTGTIGSAVVKRLLDKNPSVIRIYSRDENKQAEVKDKLGNNSFIRYFIGDIRDKDRLKMAMKDVDIVFHAAALKHVLSCEYNPFEAVKTNIIGTQNIIEVSLQEEVDRVILTSSDKAVNPSNTMGVSKLMAEKLFIAANNYKGNVKTKFLVVRFGNVLGSRGSVIPIFKEQIKRGGPLTITDFNMTRFVMSIDEAVNLLLKSVSIADGGEIFVLKMPVINIIDLAEVLLENNKVKSGNLKIEKIGIRPGEKIYEELMTFQESKRVIELEDMFVITPQHSLNNYEKVTGIERSYRSDQLPNLSKKEIKILLQREGLI